MRRFARKRRGAAMAKTASAPAGPRTGVHASIAGGLPLAAERAHAIGCQTLQIFSSSPRQWRGAELDPAACAELTRLRRAYDLRPLVIHANYLINAAGAASGLWERSIEALRGELRRARQLDADYLVLHPGAAGAGNGSAGAGDSAADGANGPIGGGREAAIARVGEAVRRAAEGLDWGGLKLLIENTAGGGRLGGSWEEMAALLAAVATVPSGACIDTCHSWAAGYDVRSEAGYRDAMAGLDRTVGRKQVHVIHVNDSKGGLGSHQDRHEHIGAGQLGRAGLRLWVNDARWARAAFILETPVDEPDDQRDDLRRLRALAGAARARPAARKASRKPARR
ncbi:MAG: deoxyribonuclease IV [Terriglobales bacterium]